MCSTVSWPCFLDTDDCFQNKITLEYMTLAQLIYDESLVLFLSYFSNFKKPLRSDEAEGNFKFEYLKMLPGMLSGRQNVNYIKTHIPKRVL